MRNPAPMTEFETALNAWQYHVRHELGYSAAESTLMIIGFGAGWVAYRDAPATTMTNDPPATIERHEWALAGKDSTIAHLTSDLAEILASIERVKDVIRAERHDLDARPGHRSWDRAYQQGRRDMTAIFRAEIERTP